MKLVYLTNIAAPYKTQQMKSWLAQVPELSQVSAWYYERGLDLVLWGAAEEQYGIREERLMAQTMLNRLFALFRFWKDIDDSILLVGGYYSFAHWMGLVLGKIRAKKVVLVFDGINPGRFGEQRGILRFLKLMFVKMCDYIFCNGIVSRDFFMSQFGVSSKKIYNQALFSHPHDYVGIIPLSDGAQIDVRRLYSLPQGKFLVAYCGRLVERKRVDDLINAVQILSGSNIHLVIIGDGPEMGNLRTQSQVIGDDVSFLGGIGDRSSLFNLLGTVDLLVLPSEDEPWGLVVNEAMSMGTPVLVSDQCGCSFDVALVPRSGMVFPTRNVGALAKGITKFMSSVQARKNVIQDSATINSPELSCRELQSMLQNSHSSNNGILIQ